MTKLHNNYKDIFRALRLGFSTKKLSMMVWGFIIAMIGYVALSYIAYLATGWTFAEIWDAYRIFPIPESLVWYGWVLWTIGALYALAVILITGTAISKVTYEQLKGDDFFQMSKAFRYATKQVKSVLLSPMMIILFIISIVIAGLMLSLLGAIPYFGEIFTGLMILPAFAASLFIIYLFIILIFTVLFTPAIVATTGDDTFDTLFEVFSMINDQPVRLIWYTIIIGFLSKFGMFFIGLFSRVAVNIGANVLSVFMGDKFALVLDNAASTFKVTIPYWCPYICDAILTRVGGYTLLLPPMYQSALGGLNITMLIATILVAAAYYLLVLFVVSYGATVWFTGTTCIYTVIVKKKDDKDLLEIKEEVMSSE